MFHWPIQAYKDPGASHLGTCFQRNGRIKAVTSIKPYCALINLEICFQITYISPSNRNGTTGMWHESRSLQMSFSHQQHISKIGANKANAVAQLHIEIQPHLWHFCTVRRNWRGGKHHIFQKQSPGNSRNCSGCHWLTFNKLIRLLQTVNVNGGCQWSPKEIAAHIQSIGIKAKMITNRGKAIHFRIARHLIMTITHLASEALQHKGISKHGQAQLNISNRIGHTLYFICAICNHNITIKGRMICSAGNMHRTICWPHRPFHIIRQRWQQAKISILQGYCQIHLFIAIKVISSESSQGCISRHHHSVGIIPHHFLSNKRLRNTKSLVL